MTTSKDALSIEALLGLNAGATGERDVYRAGELKREFGVSRYALRIYEDKGFVRPARRGIQRLYSRFDRRRLQLAILSQAFGFTLTEAAQIINVYGGFDSIGTTAGASE